MDRPAMPRTGHGAASLIPHLNPVVPLESAHFDDSILDDSPQADEPAPHAGNDTPIDDPVTGG
jgi:hypothetical protein